VRRPAPDGANTRTMEGKTIVFTGTLEVKRADATKMAVEAGATVASSVTGKIQILVAGSNAGSKVAAAQSKGVAIWSEAQFRAALQNNGTLGKRKADPSEDAAPVAKRPANPEQMHKTPATVNKKPAPEAKSPGSTQPLAGMAFLRTGRIEDQKAVGDFVRSLGGTWVKTANQATGTIDGGAYVFGNWNKVTHFQVLEQGKPVVPISSFFNSKAETPGAVEEFLQKLQTARQVMDAHAKAGATPCALARAYREAFPDMSYWSGGMKEPLHSHSQTNAPFSECVLTQQGKKGLKWTPRA